MTTFRAIIVLASCSAAACSAAPEPSAGADERTAIDVAPAGDVSPTGDTGAEGDAPAEGDVVLNRLSFEDLELAFHWLGAGRVESGRGQIGIEESFGSVDYVGTLRRQYASLTALEIFEAFAPPDIEPHPALVQQHEAEALAYGRSGAELGVRVIDGRSLDIDKALPANSRIFRCADPGVFAFPNLQANV